jgi:gamma-glutamyltranspeptidase/glutathione hydrolase
MVGCSTVNSVSNSLFGPPAHPEGTPGFVSGFLGGVVADEPRAALVGRQILSTGGNAADAAVALAFALAVTLPSRAGLAGGGACLAYNPSRDGPNNGVPEAITFVPPAPARQGGGDRPAAIPMIPRGLFALHARYGKQQFEQLISPAEQLARFGVPASRALVRDLSVVAGPLSTDPSARAVFFPGGQPLGESANLIQPDLAATISQIRSGGVGDFYQGPSAKKIADASVVAGGAFTVEDMRAALPHYGAGVAIPIGSGNIAMFLPPPADGGLAAAAAFRVLNDNASAIDAANTRGLAAATQWRRAGGDPMAVVAATDLPPPSLPPLPASTTFATLDRDGNAVVCALTMNNLFGTGRIAPGTGIVLAASPNSVPPPLLSAVLVYNGNIRAFRAEVGGTGQEGAPLATAYALAEALAARGTGAPAMPNPPPEPGRANVIECNRYLPGDNATCAWATDPRGAGFAGGSN